MPEIVCLGHTNPNSINPYSLNDDAVRLGAGDTGLI